MARLRPTPNRLIQPLSSQMPFVSMVGSDYWQTVGRTAHPDAGVRVRAFSLDSQALEVAAYPKVSNCAVEL